MIELHFGVLLWQKMVLKTLFKLELHFQVN